MYTGVSLTIASRDNDRAHFTPIIIRRELYKLFYLENDLFNLNEKADASEAFTTILSLIHASLTPGQG